MSELTNKTSLFNDSRHQFTLTRKLYFFNDDFIRKDDDIIRKPTVCLFILIIHTYILLMLYTQRVSRNILDIPLKHPENNCPIMT
jgi:hypothetical protein